MQQCVFATDVNQSKPSHSEKRNIHFIISSYY